MFNAHGELGMTLKHQRTLSETNGVLFFVNLLIYYLSGLWMTGSSANP